MESIHAQCKKGKDKNVSFSLRFHTFDELRNYCDNASMPSFHIL